MDEAAAMGRQKSAKGSAKEDGERLEKTVKSAAEATTVLETNPAEGKSAKLDIITRPALDPAAIAAEVRKGYDLFVIGIADVRDPKGGFSKALSRITQSFEGPLALVVVRDRPHDLARQRRGRILIPVSGTEVSRRGVEVGLALARANDAQVTALYVTRTNSPAGRSSAQRRLVIRRDELAVFNDIATLSERYDVPLRTSTRTDMAPDEAILREAGRGYDLVVLGVSRRPGDVLFFGNTAAAVLERSPTSKLFVAS